MEPTHEEITELGVELEREAKFNVVSKDMKLCKKMEAIKERQMSKWKGEFEEFLQRKKQEKIDAKRRAQLARERAAAGGTLLTDSSRDERSLGPFQKARRESARHGRHDS